MVAHNNNDNDNNMGVVVLKTGGEETWTLVRVINEWRHLFHRSTDAAWIYIPYS